MRLGCQIAVILFAVTASGQYWSTSSMTILRTQGRAALLMKKPLLPVFSVSCNLQLILAVPFRVCAPHVVLLSKSDLLQPSLLQT